MPGVDNLTVALVPDYSQIELRMLAEMSEDPLLIKQFNATPVPGKPWLTDVHCLIGHELTGWDPEKIKKDPDLRRSVKEFNFSLVFGVGKPSIYSHLKAKGVKITKPTAEAFYDRFFARYQGVADFISRMRAQVELHGYVETLFGFRREIYKDDESRGSYYGNQAINTPIQGTAHNLVLIALAILHIKPQTYRLLQTPVAEVHDSLYFFTKLRDLPETFKKCMYLLQTEVAKYTKQFFKRKLRVPLIAEAKAGFTYGSLTEYNGQDVPEFLEMWRKKYYETETQNSYRKELQPAVSGRKHDWMPAERKGRYVCTLCRSWADEADLPKYKTDACYVQTAA